MDTAAIAAEAEAVVAVALAAAVMVEAGAAGAAVLAGQEVRAVPSTGNHYSSRLKRALPAAASGQGGQARRSARCSVEPAQAK